MATQYIRDVLVAFNDAKNVTKIRALARAKGARLPADLRGAMAEFMARKSADLYGSDPLPGQTMTALIGWLDANFVGAAGSADDDDAMPAAYSVRDGPGRGYVIADADAELARWRAGYKRGRATVQDSYDPMGPTDGADEAIIGAQIDFCDQSAVGDDTLLDRFWAPLEKRNCRPTYAVGDTRGDARLLRRRIFNTPNWTRERSITHHHTDKRPDGFFGAERDGALYAQDMGGLYRKADAIRRARKHKTAVDDLSIWPKK